MIDILYLLLQTSRYNNEICVSKQNLTNLYFHVISDKEVYSGDEDSFNPIDCRFKISSVWKNNQYIFQSIVDENLETKYMYPTFADDSVDRNHTIIYNIDEMIGYHNEKFGIGVIPKCEYFCRPIISWFEDDVMIKKGEMLIWMNCASIGHEWHCEIECSTGIKMR